MITEPNTETNNLNNLDIADETYKKLVIFFKERITSIIIGLLSGSVIAFITSRLFIKFYLTEIGFDSLIYSALTNSQTIPSLTLSIFTVLITFITTFTLIPMILRWLYQENLPIYQNIHKNYAREIGVFFVLCFSTPLFFILKYLLEIEINSKLITYFPAISILPFILILIEKWKTISNIQIFRIFFAGLNFSLVSIVINLPFILILKATLNYEFSFSFSCFVVIILWLIFSIFTGLRIVFLDKINYLIDFFISFIFLMLSLILNSNSFLISIAEFSGIKDEESKIYKVNKSDYKKIENNIKLLWQAKAKTTSAQCLKQNNDDKCLLVFGVDNFDKNIFINAKVFFRDEKNTILCPPNVYFIGKKSERCFLINTEILTPTSQTYKSIESNKNFKTSYFILE
jgi:hypothetical protein